MKMLCIPYVRVFQSTLLQEERPGQFMEKYGQQDFNPRSYKRSDGSTSQIYLTEEKFQSTLLQEERQVGTACKDGGYQFQSTLLQEERRNRIRKDFPEVFISIHAPTRGATLPAQTAQNIKADFNPRSYKRSDACSGTLRCTHSYFNPRSYKRSDVLCFYCFHLFLNFNPRSYKRSDSICSIFSAIYCISIHAPTRGATQTHHA